MKTIRRDELREESFLDMLEKQHRESDNKSEFDYWAPLNRLIIESMELRDSKSLSQADVAEMMSTKQSVISRFENMGRVPNYDFIARLSIALGHTPGVTLHGDYMAIVPVERHILIKELAEKEHVNTQEYVQNILNQCINELIITKEAISESEIDATKSSIDLDKQINYQTMNDPQNLDCQKKANLYLAVSNSENDTASAA
jgi:transcriptional regulator with XRE-family HTH domain